MIKFLGAILIFTGSVMLGFFYSYIPYKRYKNLLMVYSGLCSMESEIRFSKSYIDDILLKISKNLKFDYIFKTASDFKKDLPISTRWTLACKKDAKNLYFTNEDIHTISMLSYELGMTDKQGQLNNINHIKSLLNNNINSSYEEYKKQSKLTKSLGICIGLFIIILLI